MKGHDDWKTDAPDDGCERCAELGRDECRCVTDHQEEVDRIADASGEEEWLESQGL
jgi:hypothetical protein